MKRRIKAILRCLSCSLILCSSLVAAGCNQTEAVPPVNEEDKMKGELTAYYVDYGNPDLAYGSLLPLLQTDFPDLKIDATAFSSVDEFTQRTITELNAGKGPDLLLLNYGIDISFEKMCRNGTYLNLTPYLEADNSYKVENYYESAMKAGQINNNQYMLPIAFSQMNLLTSKEKLETNGAKLTKDYTWENIVDSLSVAIQNANLSQSSIPPIATPMTRNDYFTLFLSGFGIPIVDMDKGQVVLDKDVCKTIADLVKMWIPYANEAFLEKKELVLDTQLYSDVQYTMCNNANYVLYYEIMQIDRALNQETISLPFPSYQSPKNYVGQIYLYTVVNSNSQNKQLAYDTARALMDLPLSGTKEMASIDSCYPIRKDTLASELSSRITGPTATQVDNQFIKFFYTEEQNLEILSSVERITKVVLDDFVLYMIVNDCLRGYIYNNTKTFDECWDDLVNRLTLYINE